jgi:predicted nucleic acid-binding Zn ribbon protein
MSRRAPRPFSLALGGLTEALAPATPLARVQRVWEQTVGATIAAAGRPTAERDGVLTVACTDAVWAAELDMMGPELVARLNRTLGDEPVHKLRCRVA